MKRIGRRFLRLVCLALLAAMLLQLTAGAVGSGYRPADDSEPAVLPTEPKPTEPKPTEPEPTEPEPTEPEPTEPEPTDPEPTDPEPTDPEPTDPEPTEPEPTDPEPTEPDPLEGYVFPEDWSREGLIFAVENGIMQGDENKDLMPNHSATRSEMAGMLMRILAASEAGDISAFTDADPNQWYYPYLQTAYALGIMKGTGATTMQPDRAITRQEAFTLLARCFGLHATDGSQYTVFKDSRKIEPYAREPISALVELGYLTGYPDGTVAPNQSITRAEVATMFLRILRSINETQDTLPDTGNALYRGTEPLTDVSLEGNLFLGCGYRGAVTVSGLEVSGFLTAACSLDSDVTFDNSVLNLLSVTTPMTVRTDSGVNLLQLTNRAEAFADAGTLVFYGDGRAVGSYDTVIVNGGNVVIDGDVGELIVSADASGSTVDLNGHADSVEISAPRVTLQGSGYAEQVVYHYKNDVILLPCGELIDEVDVGVEGIVISLTGPDSLDRGNHTAAFAATVTNLDTGFGMVDGKRVCTVQWIVDGTVVKTLSDQTISEGCTLRYTHDFAIQGVYDYNTTMQVKLSAQGASESAARTLRVYTYTYDYKNALSTVTTVEVEATVTKYSYLWKNEDCTGYIRDVPVGTKVIHEYISSTSSKAGRVHLTDGTVGWLRWENYYVDRKNYTLPYDYSVGTLEGFVNQKHYMSSSNYLVWASKSTQTVSVFSWSSGRWNLVKTGPCASGTNLTPTQTGVFKIYYHTAYWNFPPNRVYQVSGFCGGQAFHTRLYNAETGALADGTMGTPASHGCVRLMDDMANLIYNEVPMNTTVVVY